MIHFETQCVPKIFYFISIDIFSFNYKSLFFIFFDTLLWIFNRYRKFYEEKFCEIYDKFFLIYIKLFGIHISQYFSPMTKQKFTKRYINFFTDKNAFVALWRNFLMFPKNNKLPRLHAIMVERFIKLRKFLNTSTSL